MENIKKILRPYYLWYFNFKNTRLGKNSDMILNFLNDYILYKKYATVFSKSHLKNKEADLILAYHSIEKGMLFNEMKPGFAKYRIINLHRFLKDTEVIENINRSQIKVAYQVVCKYYELHKEKGFDISEFYTEEQYDFYKNCLFNLYNKSFSGIYSWDKNKFYENIDSRNFNDFAKSRQSIRNFTGEKVDIEKIKQSIELANTAPSVCNRQASNVYLVEDKYKIDEILKVQGGFAGYTENVNQLLIVTNDRKYYYTVGERNQFYIDGGVYLMNLLYALHFYKIANCPANWGKTMKEEKKLKPFIKIPESEKIICMIPIGIAIDNFNTTLSLRRPVIENFIIFK
jgi:nitroreductase